jgi:hypothetical protein
MADESELSFNPSGKALLWAPPGIEKGFCETRGLLAFQRLAERYGWHVPGASGPEFGEEPGLMYKYEDLVWEYYFLLFPERKGFSASLGSVYAFLGAVEPALLLYFKLADIRRKSVPWETRQAVFRYMRFLGVTLADFGLESNRLARAFMGRHYGIENFDRPRPRFDVLRSLYFEDHVRLDRLEPAWTLCLESLVPLLDANPLLAPEDILDEQWGPNHIPLLNKLVDAYGVSSSLNDGMRFAAAAGKGTRNRGIPTRASPSSGISLSWQ